ncbi:SDR family oxidoreductase [Pseudonocardia oroxyli]|uniref:NAD(P)-dependent dehydrogenase, short-chain alcohol dehydrogenase family n=1 Tax=Pseudonocardia oroxyli TaxID=366584 RepID=A0A1G7TM74_PSEOR|nr:SDR family oxidoreductase [Pseudonocardia oroxyli]SDG36427.1 NAD(P)-dependent dehydrogenase, short-chain alcohol dehydrogenase family [Pseudonocardia oroxyli]
MGNLDGQVAVITGAGRGIGREHALLFAKEGAKVVVNDLGGASDGSGGDPTAAEQVVEEIRALGGEAVVNGDDVADWAGAERMIAQAVEAFGRVDVLVNNAGILRDKVIAQMSESDWDSVIRVHLKGHFAPLHFAAGHWRERSKAGEQVRASVINTSSTSGLHSNPGQANYGAAKSGIATLTEIAAKELSRYGVRVNAIAPAARTRLIAQTPTVDALMPAAAEGEFDPWDPANISPLVVALASPESSVTGRTFWVAGGTVKLYKSWSVESRVESDSRWEPSALTKEIERLAGGPAGQAG